MSALIVLAPAPQEWIKLRNQLLGFQRYFPLGALSYPIHETTDRFLFRVKCTLSSLTTNLAFGKLKLSLPALDFVAKELETVPDMNDARFLRMQFHAQLFQDSAGRLHSGACLCCRFTGDHPVSSPGESHPEALAELYVSLSTHTAPTMEPRRTPICQWANNSGARREMRAIHCVALRRCRCSFWYFLLAQRARSRSRARMLG